MVKTPLQKCAPERTPLKVTAKSCKTKSQVLHLRFSEDWLLDLPPSSLPNDHRTMEQCTFCLQSHAYLFCTHLLSLREACPARVVHEASRRGLQVDRFIPARNAFDVDLASFKMLKENDNVASPTASTPSKVTTPYDC
jgi:hypothetical protein